jgi:hypothetical protein
LWFTGAAVDAWIYRARQVLAWQLPCAGDLGLSRMNGHAVSHFQLMGMSPRRRGAFPYFMPSLWLILLLALTFFLLCPLWGYLSFCSLSASHNASQGCSLYNFLFNMPTSVPMPATLLVILVPFGTVVLCRQPRMFQTSLYRLLPRAPPPR